MDTFVLAYTTFGTQADAAVFSRLLLEKKLVGCTNCIGPMTATYTWEGTIQVDEEWVLLLKTTAACLPEIRALLTTDHPYDCPCLLEFTASGGYPPFLDFLAAAVRPVAS